MSKDQSQKTRSRRSCWLSIFGIVSLVLIAAAGVFAWFYTHPISNAALHTRVLQRLERISGLDVAYDTASLTVATGKYKITNLRFIDPKRPSPPVLTIGEVHATIDPLQLVSNPESVITHVVLKNPSRLDLVYTPDSIELGERSRFLLDAVRKAQPPGSSQAGRLPFDELKIENAEIVFTESEGILPDLSPAQPVLVMAGQISLTNEGASGLDIRFNGQAAQSDMGPADGSPGNQNMRENPLNAYGASGIEVNVVINSNNSIGVQGTVENIALNKMFRDLPETSVRASDLRFDLKSNTTDTKRGIAGTVKAATLAYISPEKQIQVNDENLILDADVDLQTSAGVVQVQSLTLNSDGAKASLSGGVHYKSLLSYDVAFSAERLDEDYRALLEKVLPEQWEVDANQDSIAVNVHAIGSTGSLSSFQGTVSMRDLTLKTPALPARLKHLQGDIRFTDTAVSFADVTGEYSGARVALDGAFNGNILNADPGLLNVQWSATVDLDEALKLHSRQIDDAGMALSGAGKIVGNGTWQQNVSPGNLAASGVPLVEGNLEFQDVSLQYPSLPAPIAGLSGKTRIVNNRLEVENLSGTMQGNELSVDGYVEGETFFWRDSAVSATLKSQLDLAELGPYLTADQKANLDKYQLSGQANTDMLISGPLNELGSRFTGIVYVSGVAFTPGLEFMQGRFTGVSGKVAWDGRQLHLDNLSGRLNEEAVQLSGDISAKNIDLHIKSQTSLEAIQKTFPRFDKYLDMSGGVETELDFIVGADAPPVAGSISEVLEAARVMADAAVKDKTFSLNGILKLDDASIRHIAMPIARKEDGRQIPAGRVTGMTGTIKIKNDTFVVPESNPIKCAFSDTPKVRLSGSIQLRPDNFPAMKVKINSGGTLRLDTWATGWGKALPDLDKPPITGKKFDFEADLLAPSVIFREQEAGRSQANILFRMVQDKSPRVTDFRNVVIQGNREGQGRIIGSGRIESFVWNPQQFPRWQTSLDVQSMPLESILTAVFREQPRLQGMITGKIDLQGIGKNARSVSGRGSGFMRNLEIGGTGVIRQLGQTTGRNFGGKLFQTAQAATFEVGNGAISSRDLALDTNGLQLEMRGDYWFAGDPSRGVAPKTIEGTLRLRLFKSVFGSIPIIGAVADLADEVANAFLLAFRITGSAENPQITPVPLPLFQGGV